MARLTLITTHPVNAGEYAICLYRQGRSYHVGLLYPERLPLALPDSTFWTLDHARNRFDREVEARRTL
jgi:hypothetical protein